MTRILEGQWLCKVIQLDLYKYVNLIYFYTSPVDRTFVTYDSFDKCIQPSVEWIFANGRYSWIFVVYYLLIYVYRLHILVIFLWYMETYIAITKE